MHRMKFVVRERLLSSFLVNRKYLSLKKKSFTHFPQKSFFFKLKMNVIANTFDYSDQCKNTTCLCPAIADDAAGC